MTLIFSKIFLNLWFLDFKVCKNHLKNMLKKYKFCSSKSYWILETPLLNKPSRHLRTTIWELSPGPSGVRLRVGGGVALCETGHNFPKVEELF